MRRTASSSLAVGALLSVALVAGTARAEKIVLKDGTVLEGKIITRTGAKIFFKNRKTGEMESIRESQVARILRDAEPQPPPAATKPAPKPTPATGTPLAERGEALYSPETLAKAVQAAAKGGAPKPPADPRTGAGWKSLTTYGKKKKLESYQKALATYARALRRLGSERVGPDGAGAFRGKNVAWVLELRETHRNPAGPGLLLTAASRTGCLVTAAVGAEARDALSQARPGESVYVTGELAAWSFGARQRAGVFNIQPPTQFAARLSGASARPPDAQARRRFLEPDGTEDGVVFLVDGSAAVAKDFDAVKGHLVRGVQDLPGGARFSVIVWSSRARSGPAAGLVAATARNKAAAAKFIERIRPAGEGRCMASLMRAFRLLRSGPLARRTIFLVTGGEFTGFADANTHRVLGGQVLTGNEAVLQWLRDNNHRKDVRIHPVLFASRRHTALQVLQPLARDNAGECRRVD